MTTTMKTLAVLGSLVVLAGCSAAAEDTTPRTVGPGWRHEQMVKAWEKGERPGPMMMRGQPGIAGQFGPGRFGPPIGPDGKVDPSQMPDWCPAKQAATK